MPMAAGALFRLLILHFDHDAHKPPIGSFGDPCADHLAFETQVFRYVDPSEFGNPEAVIAQLELIVGKVEAQFAALLFVFKA